MFFDWTVFFDVDRHLKCIMYAQDIKYEHNW